MNKSLLTGFSIIILVLLLISAGCTTNTEYWETDLEIYNSTLEDVSLDINGDLKIINARSWRTFTLQCSDTETYNWFEEPHYSDEFFWQGKLIGVNGGGTGTDFVSDDDYSVTYKLGYDNTTRIIYLQRVASTQ